MKKKVKKRESRKPKKEKEEKTEEINDESDLKNDEIDRIRINKEEDILRQKLRDLEEVHFGKTRLRNRKFVQEISERPEVVKRVIASSQDEVKKPKKSIVRRLVPRKKDFPVHEHADKGPKKSEIDKVANSINKIKKEISKSVMGQEETANSLLRGILCNGHVLLEGIPGIAKTLLIKSLGVATGCDVKRVQFTVDLLPTDIIGLTTYIPDKGFEVSKGPVFTNFLIADEINRSPPKTQSAMIEVMQEKIATIGKKDYPLPSPFFVMATKNPIENLGVYPLSEAQVDRFLFNVIMGYPEEKDELKVMEDNATTKKFEDFGLKPVVNPNDLTYAQQIVHKVYLSEKIKKYIMEIVKKTRDKNFEFAEFITYGASPRASIALYIASKANALIEGRGFVLPEDVKVVIFEVLRHRLILSYKATVRKLTSDDVIKKILEEVSVE